MTIRLTSLAAVALIAFAGAAAAEPKQRFAQAEPGPKAEPPRAAPQSDEERRQRDIAFWTSVQNSNDCEAVRVYLTRFPNGLFVELAKVYEERLCAAPAVTPADQPVPPRQQQPPQQQPPQPPAPQQQPPQQQPAPQPPQPAPNPPLQGNEPGPEMIVQVQAELIRLGCSAADADGRWSAAHEAAVARFNRYGRWNFDPAAPSFALLAALRRHEHVVCPRECEPGQVLRGNVCVAAGQPRAQRNSGRSREPARRAAKPPRRAAPAQRVANPPRRAAPAQQRAAKPQRARPQRAAGRPAGRDARGCRFVPRATGGGHRGDTIEVCD